tara:strand:+ start:207 stop:509 length:303 start_codon:yes stop_codon:yes gene_type:complete
MKEYFGGCHCGEVKFKFNSNESIEIWKCNCSICKMHDYEHLFVKHDDFKVIEGEKLLETDVVENITFRKGTNPLKKRCYKGLDLLENPPIRILKQSVTVE